MADRKELKEQLKESNYHVYTILRSVSRSGMTRVVDCYILGKNGVNEWRPFWISVSVAKLLDRRLSSLGNGVICEGAGMDMGFDLIYSLSQELFGDGYKLKQSWL